MHLATATITVYFIGVVHLYNPSPGSTAAPTREVIVPQASAAGVKYGAQTLEPHEARVVIQGLTGGSSTCTALGGDYASPPPPGTATCIVPVAGKIISLPSSAETLSLEAAFGDIPRVKSLCPGVGGIKKEYLNDASKYAARLTLATGKLGTCRNGKAQVVRLTITTENPALTIGQGATAVQLQPDAVVKIINTPAGASTDEHAHFLWHYKMYDTPIFCTRLPDEAKESLTDCPADVAHIHDIHVGTGPGCTPTGP